MRILTLLTFLACNLCYGQDGVPFSTFSAKLGRAADAENLYDSLQSIGRIPFAIDDSVLFLYKGDAQRVRWMGDFNAWGGDKTFNAEGKRITGTDLWSLKHSFPPAARLDYKIIVNEEWITDPANKFTQAGGGGNLNSELRMPLWKAEPVPPPARSGTLKEQNLLQSTVMEYNVSYTVYTPPGYRRNVRYPCLYVTDGHEYQAENLGNMVAVLNHLISAGKIVPIVVVFVDPRNPANLSENRRMNELALNENYLRFYRTELIPRIEKQFSVSSKPAERGILGTSLGGLNATYFAFSSPSLFGLTAIQSPAYWFRPEIYSIVEKSNVCPARVWISTGTINDTHDAAEKMKTILAKNACTFQYKEVPQGHSWGQWKGLLDDVLIYFFGSK